MKPVIAGLLTFILLPVAQGHAQMAGVQPGNEISTGTSLPTSDKASNIGPGDTRSEIAPRLPAPDATNVMGLLHAARASLIAGRTGEAQEGLERAETRLLDRSVPMGAGNRPIRDPRVGRIEEARRMLGRGDRGGAVGVIDGVIATMRS